MAIGLKHLYGTLLAACLLGCEPFYDPLDCEDIPLSPGTVWDKKPIVVKETTELPFSAEDLNKSMSLSFLLDMALYNNPSTRSTWQSARAAAYGYRASLSDYYPTIDYVGDINAQTHKGSAFANSGQNIITTGTSVFTETFSTNLTNNISLTYLLLDFGGRDANSDYALQALYAANWQHDYTMQQVMLSVLNAYTSYIGNKGLVKAYMQDLKDAEVALEATKVMRAAGLATLNDVLAAQSTLELTRTNLIQAQGGEKTAFADILIAVGLPPDAQVCMEDLPETLPVINITGDVSSLFELAKHKRPDLGIAIAAIKQQEAQLALSYSNSMPILTANGNWNQVRFISPQLASGYNELAFLQFSFPIFQGFYYMNQQRQLRAQVEAALANLDVQVAAVATQVVGNYYSFIAAKAALPSAEAAVVSSERAYRGYLVQYKTGTASILDVLNALTTLSNARSQQITIRTQWANSLANLAFAVGILDADGGQWEDKPPEELSKIPIRDNYEKK